MPVRVGVVGTGAIGADHVARLRDRVVGATVTAVMDADVQRARDIADLTGAGLHLTWEALVAAPDVDAVVIASPGALHAEQAVACVEAGKPVLCEKPLATSSAAALDVVAAEVTAGRRLVQVGFMRRYDRGYTDLKAALDGGGIGVPLLAHAVHRNASVPDFFRGEMALTDSVVHELDVFRWLLRAEITHITVVPVRPSPLAPEGLRDPQLVVVRFSGGEVVTVESFLSCGYGYDVRCEVVGSLGTAALENPRTVVRRGPAGVADPVPASWQDRFADAYATELQVWVDAVGLGTATGPSAWDGYVATAAAEAAVTSFSTGAGVDVRLAERPGLYA